MLLIHPLSCLTEFLQRLYSLVGVLALKFALKSFFLPGFALKISRGFSNNRTCYLHLVKLLRLFKYLYF